MQTLRLTVAHQRHSRAFRQAVLCIVALFSVVCLLVLTLPLTQQRAHALPSIVGQQEPLENAGPCAQHLVSAKTHESATAQALPVSFRALHTRAASYDWHQVMLQCPEYTSEAIIKAAAFDRLALRLSHQAQWHSAWNALWNNPTLSADSTSADTSRADTTSANSAKSAHIDAPDDLIVVQDQTGFALTVLAARFETAPMQTLAAQPSDGMTTMLSKAVLLDNAQSHTLGSQALVDYNTAAQSKQSQQTEQTEQSQDTTNTQSSTFKDPRSGNYNVQVVLEHTQDNASPYIVDSQTGLFTNVPAYLEMNGALRSIQALPTTDTNAQLPTAWLEALTAQVGIAFDWGYPLQPEQLLAK